ncbi:MAG: hypothetical protein ACYC0D_03345 [Candidatus Humimicrobiaceae bacterium]
MVLLVKNVNKIVNKPEESNSRMVNRRLDKDYINKNINKHIDIRHTMYYI